MNEYSHPISLPAMHFCRIVSDTVTFPHRNLEGTGLLITSHSRKNFLKLNVFIIVNLLSAATKDTHNNMHKNSVIRGKEWDDQPNDEEEHEGNEENNGESINLFHNPLGKFKLIIILSFFVNVKKRK